MYVICSHASINHPSSYLSTPPLYAQLLLCISQLLAEVSIKECDADFTFAEEENIISKNRYRGLCPCMHLRTTYHHAQHTAQHTTLSTRSNAPQSTTYHTHCTPIYTTTISTQNTTPHSTHHTQQHTQHYTCNVHSAHIRTYTKSIKLGLFHSFACPLPLVKRSTVHTLKAYMSSMCNCKARKLTTCHTTHAIASSTPSLVYMHHLPQSLTSTLPRKMEATSMHQKYR